MIVTLSAWAAHAAPVTLLALGDSLTQGYGLPVDDGFVPQLQAWLISRGHDVVVINAGVSGDTTAGGLARAAWSMTPDVDAMMVALGGNDLLRGIDPANSRANLDALLAEAATHDLPVLLVGMTAPGNFGPEYKLAFDQMYPDLAAKYDAALAPGFFDALTGKADQAAAMATYMQADGLHPNAAGVAEIVKVIGPQIETLLARIPPP